MDKIINQIKDSLILQQIDKVVPFHGYLTTGAFIGIQMYNLATKYLDVKNDERIYVTCETYNCLPDPFQILGGATIGNKGLRIKDTGKMVAVVNKKACNDESKIQGIRIYLDPEKTQKYPVLHYWYMNFKKYHHQEVLPELIEAGENVYTCTWVNVEVPVKKPKSIALCNCCGESFIQNGSESLCLECTDHTD